MNDDTIALMLKLAQIIRESTVMGECEVDLSKVEIEYLKECGGYIQITFYIPKSEKWLRQ